ncbi:MAG: polysaccharide pyruvyl transferase family protein [Paludibacteraceae bacterium]|nr:polysaccharide pyruvyl transferase family protein [Paludibacteraceae bacterium]
MKIGVVTFWQTRDNYGQMLQCWALQCQLKKMGHEPFLVRYAHSEHKYPFLECLVHFFKNLIRFKIKNLFLRQKHMKHPSESERKRDFAGFKDKYLEKTSAIYYSCKDVCQNLPEADCYIVGSDQVWGRSFSSDDGSVFMLQFAPPAVPRISYAASFGKPRIKSTAMPSLSKCLARFKAVSVRERSGVEICRQAGINATLVLDPTLLIPFSEYATSFAMQGVRRNRIFIYSLNISSAEEIGWENLKDFAAKRNLEVMVTPSSGYIEGSELFGKEVLYQYSTIPEWLTSIKEAQLVVTTSFHGVMFCIQAHTPFVYVPLNGRFSSGNNRVLDFLEVLKIKVPIYRSGITYEELLNMNFDWEYIDNQLEELRKHSRAFLENSLA